MWACCLPACVFGEIDTALRGEAVPPSTCCGAATGLHGGAAANRACCAAALCGLSLLALQQRKGMVAKYQMNESLQGCCPAVCAACFCLPCVLLQAKRCAQQLNAQRCAPADPSAS